MESDNIGHTEGVDLAPEAPVRKGPLIVVDRPAKVREELGPHARVLPAESVAGVVDLLRREKPVAGVAVPVYADLVDLAELFRAVREVDEEIPLIFMADYRNLPMAEASAAPDA